MTRLTNSLSLLSAAALLAAGANAQCFTSTGTSITAGMTVGLTGFPVSDEGFSALIPLGFAVNVPGATGGGARDHIRVGSNGEIYVTDATNAGFAYFPTGFDTLAELRTNAACPVIVAWGDDLDGGLNGGTWDIKVDQVSGSYCKVTWENVGNWLTTDEVSFSATIDVAGTITFSYDTSPDWALGVFSQSLIGVSRASGVGTGTEPSSDFSAGVAVETPAALIYQLFTIAAPDVNDLSGRSILFVPGTTGYVESLSCEPAFHEQFGTGCYSITGTATEAFYQLFADTNASAAALVGNALTMVPSGNGYNATFGAGTLIAHSVPTVVTIGDDDEVDIPVSVPFPHVSGPISPVSICSNGILQMGAVPTGNDVFVYGTTFELLNDPVAAFRANKDYDPSAGGTVQYEEVAVGADTVLVVTWLNVPIFNNALATDTFQFQATLSGPNAGRVRTVWSTVAGAQPNDTLVGYAPGGGSNDAGSIVLATALPLTTSPDLGNVDPLTLSGSPAPVITGGTGPAVNCTYTVSNVPEFDPINAPGFGVCLLLVSVVGSIPGGLDLGTFPVDIGMPGCSVYVATQDATVDISNFITGGAGGTLDFSIAMPAPLFPGLEFYFQALAILPPGTPATGSNNITGTPYGGRTSNGLTIHYELF